MLYRDSLVLFKKKQVQFKEELHSWLLPMTSFNTAKLRTVCSQEGENDVGMIRSFKKNKLLCTFSNFENKLLPNDLIIVKNHGDDEEDVEEEFGDVQAKLEVQFMSSSTLPQSSRAACTKTDSSILDILHMHRKIRR